MLASHESKETTETYRGYGRRLERKRKNTLTSRESKKKWRRTTTDGLRDVPPRVGGLSSGKGDDLGTKVGLQGNRL